MDAAISHELERLKKGITQITASAILLAVTYIEMSLEPLSEDKYAATENPNL